MYIAVFLAVCLTLVLISVRHINIIQLQGYKLNVGGSELKHMIWVLGLTLVAEVVCVLLSLLKQNLWYISLCVIVIPLAVYSLCNLIFHSKTPLVITARITRFFVLYTIVTILLLGLTLFLSLWFAVDLFYLIWINILIIPLVVRFVFLLISPLEKWISNKYFANAINVLDANKNLMKIGITGSYGKTSVKNILATILEQSFKVAKSPYSYNTPMGLCKSVKEINEDTEIFIMEIGARRVGDVAKMAKALKPQIGIITGIAPQHLQTFGSVEDVMRGKFELIEALDSNGIAVFNGENVRVKNMYDRCILKRKILVNIEEGNVRLSEIQTGANGTNFVLHIGNENRECHTKLIGKHSLENILLAVVVAVSLGMDIDSISYGIEKLEFTPHRLQVLRANGVTIIDDSYNANEVGVGVALDALALFNERKIVLCQGIVELGDKENEINYNLGGKIAGIADIAILVGKLSSIIEKGLLDSGYNPTRIVKYDNLRVAQKHFKQILKKNDVLLLLNDLPDNY